MGYEGSRGQGGWGKMIWGWCLDGRWVEGWDGMVNEGRED